MTAEEFYRELKNRFEKLLKENDIGNEAVSVVCRALSPEEAIGNTRRKDFPILTGNDVMIQAEFRGSRGQAFTDAPLEYAGSLSDVLAADLSGDPHARGLYIATMNAVMRYLGICTSTAHCRTEGPEKCAGDILSWLRENYGDRKRIGLVGYQPAILSALAKSEFSVRCLDLNPDNIGTDRCGVTVEDGVTAMEDVKNNSDLLLVTGSTVCNGTIVDYLGLKTEVVFFGMTISGTAELMGLKRICFADRYE